MNNNILVEDNPAISKLPRLHLHSENFQFKACGTGEDAIRELAIPPFDLVIFDINLHPLYRMELYKKFRKLEAATPIMMLTCNGEQADKVCR